MTYTHPTSDFNIALMESEYKAIGDLGSKWCVVLRYGLFIACQKEYALQKDYAIVCETIY